MRALNAAAALAAASSTIYHQIRSQFSSFTPIERLIQGERKGNNNKKSRLCTIDNIHTYLFNVHKHSTYMEHNSMIQFLIPVFSFHRMLFYHFEIHIRAHTLMLTLHCIVFVCACLDGAGVRAIVVFIYISFFIIYSPLLLCVCVQ